MKKRLFLAFSLIASLNLFAKDSDLMMATTTSTDNTGLLDALYPVYKKATGVDLKWSAVGTGKALKMGEKCDVDILFVHSPKVELEFIKNGYGIDRTPIMYNDFVVIADKSLANKFKNKNLKEVFETIKKDKIKFFSRGDKSGTNNKELSIWQSINFIPNKESWYNQTGQGMLSTINIAAEQKGVTLSDRATFIKYEDNKKDKNNFVIISQGDENLKNYYSVIAINPKHCKNADILNAKEFISWISSKKGQEFIANFKLLNKQLFTPNANDTSLKF